LLAAPQNAGFHVLILQINVFKRRGVSQKSCVRAYTEYVSISRRSAERLNFDKIRCEIPLWRGNAPTGQNMRLWQKNPQVW